MRKIGELKGKPIIEGNPNEIKKNQIHYKESDGSITLSERKGDNTLSSVTSGSGSGEDAFQYFKIIDNDSLALGIISGTCKVVEVIYFYHDSYVKINRIDGYNTLDHSLAQNLNNCIAFKVICGDFLFIPFNEDIITVLKGNTLKDRILYASEINDNPEELIALIQMLDSAIQEITKEEYESMITYKPE